MPTFRHGRGTTVLVNEHDLSTYFREASSSMTADTAESTAFKSTVKTYVIGMTDGRLSLGGMFSGDANGVDEELQAIFGAEAGAIVTHAPEGTAIGRRVVSGAAHEASYGVQGSVSDLVAVSAEFQATGGWRSGVSLLSEETDVTTTVDAADVDNGASTDKGAYGCLHVVANTRDAVADIIIEHSADDVTYATLASFTQVPATGLTAERVAIASGVTINRYVRAAITLAAGTGTINAHVNLVRLAA